MLAAYNSGSKPVIVFKFLSKLSFEASAIAIFIFFPEIAKGTSELVTI